MRTNDLRKLIVEKLTAIKTEYNLKEVYFFEADDKKMYPHLVVNLGGVDIGDFFRKDYTVEIDIYTRNNPKLSANVGDAIEDIFCNSNAPNETILPTFFLQTRLKVDDQDKDITHEVIRLQCQLYDNK